MHYHHGTDSLVLLRCVDVFIVLKMRLSLGMEKKEAVYLNVCSISLCRRNVYSNVITITS